MILTLIVIALLATNVTEIEAKNTLEPMISIGLKSVAYNADYFEVKGEMKVRFGIMKKEGMDIYGKLDSNYVKVKASNNNYYTDGKVYNTYDKAIKGIKKGEYVCYIRKGVFKRYNNNKYGVQVTKNSKRMNVYNMYDSKLLLISENNDNPIYLQSGDSGHSYGVTDVNGTKYRGGVRAVVEKGKVTAVNKLPMEEYLYGVVPYEMPAGWNIEALKAQAVCARTYANVSYDRFVAYEYNLNDTTECQVYKGIAGEKESTNRAVDETRNKVVWYGKELARTYYSSTNGGYTESSKNMWGGEYPYLIAKPDPYEDKPEMKPWTRKISVEEIKKCLDARNRDVGEVQNVFVDRVSESGRAMVLTVLGSEGYYNAYRYDTCSFWSASKEGTLPSNFYKLYVKRDDDGKILWVTICGKGFGHGVGMSQSGARGMADRGKTYEQIIKFYFEGTYVY